MRPLPTNRLALTLLSVIFSIPRSYYRIRYRRVELGKHVLIAGRLRITGSIRVRIGDGCRIGKGVQISGGGSLDIGPNTFLNGPWIHADTTISIGRDCLLSACQVVDTDFHNVDPASRHEALSANGAAPITIAHNVWIGGGAMILKGVHIGPDSVVGAGTIVRRDVPERVVVIGNPQVIVRQL
ncbi:MAG: hypothetical protein QOE87_4576 [Gaiellales bacterium]|nr:hypothetical protein [Gaiellales bacterium]